MTEMKRRLQVAMQGGAVLVLRGEHRDARDNMIEDARTLNGLDLRTAFEVKQSKMTIRFKDGGVIWYLGGDRHYLEERTRGMRVDFLEGGGWLPPGHSTFLLNAPRLS